jgi:hypothetical protein
MILKRYVFLRIMTAVIFMNFLIFNNEIEEIGMLKIVSAVTTCPSTCSSVVTASAGFTTTAADY